MPIFIRAAKPSLAFMALRIPVVEHVLFRNEQLLVLRCGLEYCNETRSLFRRILEGKYPQMNIAEVAGKTSFVLERVLGRMEPPAEAPAFGQAFQALCNFLYQTRALQAARRWLARSGQLSRNQMEMVYELGQTVVQMEEKIKQFVVMAFKEHRKKMGLTDFAAIQNRAEQLGESVSQCLVTSSNLFAQIPHGQLVRVPKMPNEVLEFPGFREVLRLHSVLVAARDMRNWRIGHGDSVLREKVLYAPSPEELGDSEIFMMTALEEGIPDSRRHRLRTICQSPRESFAYWRQQRGLRPDRPLRLAFDQAVKMARENLQETLAMFQRALGDDLIHPERISDSGFHALAASWPALRAVTKMISWLHDYTAADYSLLQQYEERCEQLSQRARVCLYRHLIPRFQFNEPPKSVDATATPESINAEIRTLIAATESLLRQTVE